MDEKRIISGAKVAYFFIFLVTPITFIIRVFFSRVMTIEEFGTFYAVLGIISLATLFVGFALNAGLIHFCPKLMHEKKHGLLKKTLMQILFIQLGLTIVVSFLLYIFRGQLAVHYFHNNLVLGILPVFAVLFVFTTLFGFITAFFTGVNNEWMYASMNPVRLIIVFIASICVYFVSGKNLLYAFSIIWALSFALALIYIIIAMKKYGYFLKEQSPKESFFKNIFHYSVFSISSDGASFLMGRTDVVLLTFFHGVKEVALYEAIVPLVTFVLIFLNPLSSFLFPMISELHHTNNKSMIDYIINAAYNLGFFIVLPVVVLSVAFAPQLVETIFGPAYLPGVLALQILAFGFMIKSFASINFTLLDGIGEIKKKTYIFYGGVALSLILNILLIPRWSILGAAIATTISFSLMFFMSVYVIRKMGYSIRFSNWHKIILINLLILVMALLLKRYLELNVYIKMGIIIIICSILYCLIGYLLKIVDYKEIIKVAKMGVNRKEKT